MDNSWIREGLKQEGKTQAGLGRAMGLLPQRVQEIVKDLRRVQLEEAEKAAAYLGVPLPIAGPQRLIGAPGKGGTPTMPPRLSPAEIAELERLLTAVMTRLTRDDTSFLDWPRALTQTVTNFLTPPKIDPVKTRLRALKGKVGRNRPSRAGQGRGARG